MVRSTWMGVFVAAIFGAVALAGCGGSGSPTPPIQNPPPGGNPPLVFATFQRASTILGQATELFGDPQGGLGSANPWGMLAPRGVAGLESGLFYVADSVNDRVLGYDLLPTDDGAAADFVLGQPLLYGNTGGGTAADRVRSPGSVVVAGNRLFVCDVGNDRVLIWNALPPDDVPADVVVGQADFASSGGGLGPARLDEPRAIAATNDLLVVADGASARVLLYSPVPSLNGRPAQRVLGQPDFVTALPGTGADGLGIGVGGVWTDGTRLVVSDTGNNRVLIWNALPTTNGQPADVVVGQPDFLSNAPAAGPRGLDAPAGVWATDTQLFVADQENHRVLIYEPFPTSNEPAATRVLGQSNFTNNAPDDDDQNGVVNVLTTDRVMERPRDVKLVGDRLVVADEGNHRVLVFDAQ